MANLVEGARQSSVLIFFHSRCNEMQRKIKLWQFSFGNIDYANPDNGFFWAV